MSMQLTVVRLFLASPGDLQPEREAIRDVVQGVNQSIGRRLGKQIQLFGWEDTRPGFGRPQSLINPEVEACDLFLGLLWQRWGTQTGSASSGFEEEFNIAMRRRETSELPEIWLYLKRIPSSALKDPGEQLQRVLGFHAKVQDSRKLLFKDFKNVNSLKSELYESLSGYLLDMQDREARQSGPQAASGAGAAASVTLERIVDPPPSLSDALTAAGSVLHTGGVLSPSQLARLHLWTGALTSAHWQEEPLGTHSTNFLYQHRSTIELTVGEGNFLFETILSDVTETKPGWYWFQQLDVESFVNIAPERLRISEPFIRGYLDVMGRLGRCPSREILNQIAAAPDTNIRKLLEHHLIFFGAEDDITSVQAHLPEADTRRISIGVMSRTSPESALRLLIMERVSLPSIFQLVPEDTLRRISVDDLLHGLENPDPDMRLSVVRELQRRNRLEPEHLEQLKSESHRAIRLIAYRNLIHKRLVTLDEIVKSFENDYSARMELMVEHFRSLSDEDLAQAFVPFDSNTYGALQVLIERRDAELTAVMRHDLAFPAGDALLTFEERAFQSVRNSYGKAGEAFVKLYHRYADLLRSFAVSATLKGMAASPDSADKAIARKWVGHDNPIIAAAATELFVKTAGPEDASLLVDLALSTLGEQQEVSATTAISLVPHDNAPALRFLRSDDPDLQRLALSVLRSRSVAVPDDLVLPLLNHEDPSVQSAAVAYLIYVKSRSELETILDSYTSNFHYYHVVVLFDRLLYAPGPLADSYKRALVANT